jgi:hypothetical protein
MSGEEEASSAEEQLASNSLMHKLKMGGIYLPPFYFLAC